MFHTIKEYIPLSLFWSNEGKRDYNDMIVPYIEPTCLFLEAGGRYGVDAVRKDGLLPSALSGGYGLRYTARTSCDAEENYDKVYYLYFEQYRKLGRWRLGDEYVAADVTWGANGDITPTCIYIDGHAYTIGDKGIIKKYAMSTRKTDGSGMRYIVRASCRVLRDYDREFALMLENGGQPIGRWFYEDADVVHRRKVLYNELSDQAFDFGLVEEAMGVSHMCARFQTTIDLTDFLREWNSREHDGIWLPPEIFEKKVREGIIYPKYYHPIMVAEEDDQKIVPTVMQWGLERPWVKKKVIHNLTSEKLASEDTFNSIKGNRCIIPCGGFYEFEKHDNKVTGDFLFCNNGHEKMYLAGLYEQTENGGRYTIITTKANSSVDIHHRMPVVLRREECKGWLYGKLDFSHVSDRNGIVLIKEAV